MTDLRLQRRLAAAVMKCGVNRVYIDPDHTDQVAEAVTREDVTKLVRRGLVEKRPEVGTSRGRARKVKHQRSKGRRRGPGSRKGKAGARDSSKSRWIRRIRAVRDELKALRQATLLSPTQYRRLYRRAKGGVYTSRAHLRSHVVMEGIATDEQVRQFHESRKGGEA